MVCPADPPTMTTLCVVSGTTAVGEALAKLKPLNTSAAPTTETATIPSTRLDFFFVPLLTADMIPPFSEPFRGYFRMFFIPFILAQKGSSDKLYSSFS